MTTSNIKINIPKSMQDGVALAQELKSAYENHVVGGVDKTPTKESAIWYVTEVIWCYHDLLETKDIEQIWREIQVRQVMES